MKVIPALFFVALGVWLTFKYPEQATQMFGYIDYGFTWVIEQTKNLIAQIKK